MTNFDIVIKDDGIVVISGLPSADEARMTAVKVEKERWKQIRKEVESDQFFEKAMKEITESIIFSSKAGSNSASVSGYGFPDSPFRAEGYEKASVIKDIIQNQIFPILAIKGYSCRVEQKSFCRQARYYFNIYIDF